MFDFDEQDSVSPLQASTPKSVHPLPASTSTDTELSCLQPSIELSTVQDMIDKAVQPLRLQLSEHSAQLRESKEKLNSAQNELTKTRLDLEEAKKRIFEQEFTIRGIKSQIESKPPNFIASNDVSITPLDVVKIHELDSETPSYELDHETVTKIKSFAKSQKIFISNVTRKMFSIEERARDCNVAGAKDRPLLSPSKTRFEKICAYTAQQYGLDLNGHLACEVRQTIDNTNRKYRDDLRRKKSKKCVEMSQIVARENVE